MMRINDTKRDAQIIRVSRNFQSEPEPCSMLVFNKTRLVLILALFVGLNSGCCFKHGRSKQTCPTPCTDVTQNEIAAPPSQGIAGVSSQFAQINEFGSAELITGDQPLGTGFLTIENTICLAAQNSAKANLLESQLRRLNQTPTDTLEQPECRETLNRSIRAQVMEERNRSASLAAQLFLGLVEVQLQRELLVESKERLTKIKNTIEEADDEGFATAEPSALLAKQSVKLAEKESELHYNDQKVRAQLAALLSLSSSTQLEISYDLRPVPHYIDIRSEQANALSQRAELVELQHMLANWNECTTTLGSTLLALADPRLKVELAKLKQAAESSWIWFFLKPEKIDDNPCEDVAVRQQTQRYFENSRDVAFLNIKLAALDMQNSFEKMVISDDEIQRLEQRVEQIKASRDLDATKAYIDLQENWYLTQVTRSARISHAIQYESAQIRLAEANGALAQLCGFDAIMGNGCVLN